MKKLLLLSALALSTFCKAQNPFFSQAYSAPMLVNPALAGGTGAGRFTNVQKQIGDFKDGYKNIYFGYDQMINKIKSGIGVYFLGENGLDGKFIDKRFGINYAVPFLISKAKKIRFAPAIEFAFQQSKWDLSQFNSWSSSYIDSLGIKEKVSAADIGLGFLLNNDRLNFGITAKHLNKPSISHFRDIDNFIQRRINLVADYVFGKLEEKKKIKIAPGIRYDYYPEYTNFNTLTVTCAAVYRKFKLGFGYSGNSIDNGAALIQISYDGLLFKFRYCYDLYTGAVSGSNSGAHEVSTAINLFAKKKKDDFIANPMFAF